MGETVIQVNENRCNNDKNKTSPIFFFISFLDFGLSTYEKYVSLKIKNNYSNFLLIK